MTPTAAIHRTGTDLEQTAAAAAALIELAIQESLAPIERLSLSLAGLAAGGAGADLAPELTACIESLQFHDRMIQLLTQVRELLAHIAAGPDAAAAPVDWTGLREQLRENLGADSHRLLFDLLLPAGGRQPAWLASESGGAELF